MKKDKEDMDNSNAKTKKGWSYEKSMKDPSQRVTVENDSTRMRLNSDDREQNEHAIAIAATTVAAADMAVAGAQAAVAVADLIATTGCLAATTPVSLQAP
nr:hypothetical protein [Tanacetum cinerariifolium]